jgi:glycosyltransferase involved in cell wall biosynthesis
MPYISVIVPVLNEADILERALLSIRAQTFSDYELIVIDNGSTDDSPKIAAKYADKVLFEAERGYIQAVHRGISEAKGEVVTACDADTVYPKGWLERMAHYFRRDERVVAVYGPMGFDDTSKILGRGVIAGYVLLDFLSRPFGVRLSGGANLGIRRDAYFKVGGYILKSKLASQDFILVKKLGRIGRIKFVPTLYVYTSARRFRRDGFVRGFLRAFRLWGDVAFRRHSLTYEAYYDAAYYEGKRGPSRRRPSL